MGITVGAIVGLTTGENVGDACNTTPLNETDNDSNVVWFSPLATASSLNLDVKFDMVSVLFIVSATED